VLFPAEHYDGLRTGAITVAFRSWKRPTVIAGGTLKSPGGLLGIDEVVVISRDDVTDADARSAGLASAAEVFTWIDDARLIDTDNRQLYRIRFHRIGDDPRIELRRAVEIDATERAALDARLGRWDRGADGPWTAAILEVIARSPGIVSTTLAEEVGMDRPTFKRRVRQLKELGFTESLEVGYRLSPRGEAYRTGR
jgi:Winged helix-turn-helix DNA-binding